MDYIRRIWLFVLVFLLINIIVVLAFSGLGDLYTVISNFLPVAASLVALFFIGKASLPIKSYNIASVGWGLLFLGSLSYFFAETIYMVLESFLKWDMNNTFPSIADVFWCIGSILFIIGLSALIHGFRKSGFGVGKRYVFWLIVLGNIFFFLLVAFVFLRQIISDCETNLLSKIFYLFYPITDVVLVGQAIAIFYISSYMGKGKITMVWRMIAVTFACFTLADLVYSYLGWLDLYEAGNPIEIAWNFGYLALAMAGAYQTNILNTFKRG
jgi:hypothetical protein